MRNNSVNYFEFGPVLDQYFRRCCLKNYLSRGLAALMFSGVEPFMQIWQRALWR